jgi:hypothetical protein
MLITKSDIKQALREALSEIHEPEIIENFKHSIIRESFYDMVENTSAREYDDLVLEFDQPEYVDQINELFGFGEKLKSYFSGKKPEGSERGGLHPNVEEKFAKMKKNLNLAITMYNSSASNERDVNRAAKYIYELLSKRQNPVQILKNMTDLGYKSQQFWDKISDEIERGVGFDY